MSELVRSIDRNIYRVERMFVVTALMVMSIVVFFDVVHRTFSAEDDKFVEALVTLMSFIGVTLEPGDGGYQRLESAAPYILTTSALALTYFGIRTAARKEPIPPVRAVLYAVVGIAIAYGALLGFLKLFPNGLIWSQPLALVLTLWVGFIGASMCTYENKHLRVEAVQRFIPERLRVSVAFLSAIFTASFCLGLAWLSLRYVGFTYEEYVETEGQGGVFPGLDAPKYVCFAALPVAFGVMTARFILVAVRALGGELPHADDPVEALLEDAPPVVRRAGLIENDVPQSVIATEQSAQVSAPESDSEVER